LEDGVEHARAGDWIYLPGSEIFFSGKGKPFYIDKPIHLLGQAEFDPDDTVIVDTTIEGGITCEFEDTEVEASISNLVCEREGIKVIRGNLHLRRVILAECSVGLKIGRARVCMWGCAVKDIFFFLLIFHSM